MRRAPAAILVAALSVLGVSGAALLLRTPAEAPAPPVATTDAASPSAGPRETLDEQVERVAGVVEDVRGLAFRAPPDLTVLEPGDLAARVIAEVEGYTEEEAELDRRMLELLGAVPPGTDVRELLITALGEQVAGFYDPDTGELVVGAQDPEQRVGRIEELTLAHELQHALADQVHGLPDLDTDDGLDDDRILAVQSLIEGDATVTMQEYAAVGFSAIDQLLLAGEAAALAGQLESLTQLPPFLQGALEFPYLRGAAFVSTLRDRGGWAAVDAAYDDPPRTSWEILFPEHYPAELPAPPEPQPPPAPWTLARTASVGAADLLLLLQAPGADPSRAVPDAEVAVRAWRGGQLALHVDGERSAVDLVVATEGPALCRAVDAWLVARGDEAGAGRTDGAPRELAEGVEGALECSEQLLRLRLSDVGR